MGIDEGDRGTDTAALTSGKFANSARSGQESALSVAKVFINN